MYHLYKGLHILYWTIGGLCIVTAAVWALFYPKQAVYCAILMSVIIISSMIILSLIAKRRFKDEVMSSLYNCHTREYLEKLDFRMKKNKRALNNMGTLSLYNCLKALGYNVLGDYDTSFQYAQNVLSKSHFTEKYKLTIDYYIEKEEYSLARNDINKLKELIPSVKSADYKKKLERFVLQRELWINIKQGNYKGAEEFYTEEVFDCSKEVMVTKVSYYTSLGEILFLKGKTEEAADYLRFAAENGGDTKYHAISAQILSKLTS